MKSAFLLSAILGSFCTMNVTVAAPETHPMQGITYNSCNPDGKFIALTFDDGPHPENSVNLLNTLKEHNAKATFFVLGNNVEKHPELLKRMHAEGHEIGNHSWSHPHLTPMEKAEVRNELEKTNKVIVEATGQSPKVFRPPFLDTNSALERWINDEMSLKSILCSVDSLDWRDKDPALARLHVLQGAAPGAIVLMHERASTAEALSGILQELKARGYTFLTVSELLAKDRTAPSP